MTSVLIPANFSRAALKARISVGQTTARLDGGVEIEGARWKGDRRNGGRGCETGRKAVWMEGKRVVSDDRYRYYKYSQVKSCNKRRVQRLWSSKLASQLTMG
jgi:hypothetical protein